MPARRKGPRFCAGCFSNQSQVWHRQRGNNKFFCSHCQAKKIAAKQQDAQKTEPTTTAADDGGEKSESRSTTPAPVRSTKSESSPELGGENPELSACREQSEMKTDVSKEISSALTDLEKIQADTKMDDQNEKLQDEISNSFPKEEISTSPSDEKEKRSSPIKHPRLTRLRSSNRPVRQAALASVQKSQDRPEKQSYSRSSSAAGGNCSVKSTGSNLSLSGIGSSSLIVPRNKGRRHIFKLIKPEKATTRRATFSTHDSLWNKGQLFRQSDVVGVVDEQDGNVYYATIRGLIRDEYCQQSAALTWLLPTTSAPADRTFDPVLYVLGPEDETFYPLDSLEFICHLPNDYFKDQGASITTLSTVLSRASASKSTSLNPQDQFAGIMI